MAKKKLETVRLFHGTSVDNLDSILETGLKSKFEGVYLTDSAESAARWIGFRLQGAEQMVVIEVEVTMEHIVEGMDHSEFMVTYFKVGKSLLSLKNIPPGNIKDIHMFQLKSKV